MIITHFLDMEIEIKKGEVTELASSGVQMQIRDSKPKCLVMLVPIPGQTQVSVKRHHHSQTTGTLG